MDCRNRILVVDDDLGHRTMLRTLMTGWGYEVTVADDGTTGVDAVKSAPFDMVLMDMKMITMSGMEALEEIHGFNPSLPVIIMTAYSSVETAVTALKRGAVDYLTKPLDFEKLKLTLARMVETLCLKQENLTLRQSLGKQFNRENIIGNSPAMLALLETVEMVAPSEANILIYGESGTGKELIAGALHQNSTRRVHPFVRINCAAITETLLESELFGHERGAFTGADRRRKGSFLAADRGSILLDEIGEMNQAMQAKLLRVLQEREVTPVGSETPVPVDVRVMASTNRDLARMVEQGHFRQDLFFRLNVVGIEIPPLRARSQDVPVLALHFLRLFAEKNNRDIRGFTPEAMDAMIHYPWPGNVRELMNSVERGVVLARSDYLNLNDLPFIRQGQVMNTGWSGENPSAGVDRPLAEIEQEAVLKTLASADNNKSEAARRLGITRKTLLKKLRLYGEA
ncbi:sigma-54 dependent two component transcriptional regulator [Desulforapulum autotrophicum HRM2]|uniref:Sigma-54 dependent two component transcriptional regulator n=1 Tax=Desulforapulum autotrophicum (strain ATCC 43914 / DSM 3382 / VKM B-1955 / HRM2) TaxID=177437 RepID=C0QD07_DESAH|nr:sigma-54 dependent transcriptional regulator [Desulforapulum autotrophicum]ACN17239.1 sigma-54 dependent two component transcriptional regulator [Desulforapulum autotrophicum HRM2]